MVYNVPHKWSVQFLHASFHIWLDNNLDYLDRGYDASSQKLDVLRAPLSRVEYIFVAHRYAFTQFQCLPVQIYLQMQ